METVFLFCFVFGAIFAVASLVFGALGGHAWTPHMSGGHHGAPVAAHSAGGSHGALPGAHGSGPALSAEPGARGAFALPAGGVGHQLLPLLNLTALVAFVAWFGAGGYIMSRLVPIAVLDIPAGLVCGAAAAAVIVALQRKLASEEQVMDPDDYRLVGTLARVTIPIPAEGVGEIVFTKAGSRRSEGARSKSGEPISHDAEVVIVAYEGGLAAVEPWRVFIADEQSPRNGVAAREALR